MEEKPIRKTDWLGVASLCSGFLGLVTSFWVSAYFSSRLHDGGFLSIFSLTGSPVIALLAVILGILSLTRARTKRTPAILGILLGVLALMGACLIYVYGMFFAQ